jgi:Asp-tRNA(Asn)/Glu-tRNA(Gln) amidotransferase A subunit family amidase
MLRQLSASDYMHAQRLRSGIRRELAHAFLDVDLLAFPTTTTTARRVTDAEFEGGFVDARARDALCRFTFLAI